MKKLSKYLFFVSAGGCIYYTFEVIFRGFSHWSMFLLGGICFLFFEIQGELVGWGDALWRQLVRCIIFVLSMEFITGIVVNKWMHLGVWDYTGLPFQLFGQICLPFAVIFSGLSVIGIIMSGYLSYWLYGGPKPHFHVL